MPKILLVEDDPILARAFGNGLQNSSFEVITVASAQDAVVALMRYDIGLMILDMNLPDAPGTNVLDYVESEPSLMGMPILVLTAYTRFMGVGVRQSVFMVLQKPLNSSALVQAVEDALAG